MTSWFEQGRPALFKALEKACVQIDTALYDELKRHGVPLQEYARSTDCINSHNVDGNPLISAINSAITTDTSCLLDKGPVEPPPSTVPETQVPNTQAPPASTSPHGEDTDWKHEFGKLSTKFSLLDKNFKKAKEYLQTRKDERNRWLQHAAFLEKKIMAAELEHNITIVDWTSKKLTAQRHLAKHKEAARPLPDVSFSSSDAGADNVDTDVPMTSTTSLVTNDQEKDERPIPRPMAEGAQEAEKAADLPQNLPSLPSDETVQHIAIKEEPSSDGAVFISERCLKKRKYPDAALATPMNTRIKTSLSQAGSSPFLALPHFDFNPHESPDLGEVSALISTPRKPREVSNGNVQEKDGSQIRAEFHGYQEQDSSEYSQDTSSTTKFMENNRRCVNKAAASKQSEQVVDRDLVRGIASLAEDGDRYDNRDRITPITRTTGSTARSRLGALMNPPSSAPSPAEHGSSTRSWRNYGLKSFSSRDDLGIPKPRDLPFERSRGEVGKERDTSAVCQPPRGATVNSASFQTPKTPLAQQQGSKTNPLSLRHKSPSELNLDDFRVNPELNDGLDFAFAEVVRGKDERACLDGCVSMSCCGPQMRALALSQRAKPPLTAEQRQEEQQILEEYLGDYCYKLGMMSKPERDELWVEAKMRELANKVGNHRHRFPRMRSPPGFWNADFPTTQELKDDRVEGRKRVKQQVLDRYREAMRPGGRWLFRDE